MKNFFRSKHGIIFLLLIISSIFLFTSFIPNIYEASVGNLLPADRTLLWGEHVYTYDYNVYLSKIRQGAESRWLVADKYDNNSQDKGAFLQMLYLFAGKVGGVFRLSPTITYHLLRTVVSFIWILTIIYLCVRFLKEKLAFSLGVIFSLLAASWPVFFTLEGAPWVGYYMGWWGEMNNLERISYFPHYTLNYIAISLLTLFLYLFAKKYDKKYFFWIILILFVSFFIHPSAGLVFLFSWIIYWFLSSVFRLPSSDFRFPSSVFKIVIFTLILFLVSLIPLLYFRHLTSSYPWKSLIDFDAHYQLPFNYKEYILALGPVFFTGIAGLILALKKRSQEMLPIISWLLAAFFGIVFFTYFPFQSRVRFIQTANHIPLAILSGYLFSELIKKYKNLAPKIVVYIIIAAILILGIVQTIYAARSRMQFIHQKATATLPLVPYPSQVMYPLSDFWGAILWLEKNTNHDEVVLSKVTAGNYIPAYSGNFVYLGHNPETPHFEQREGLIKQFFSFNLPHSEAKKFLKNNTIKYVFYGPQEKEESRGKAPPYDFLTPVYNSGYITIYKVK